MAEVGELTCERDRVSTRLTCVQCRTPICPQCLVRTPVGMKCATCGAEPGGKRSRRGPSRGLVGAGVAAVVVLAVVVLPRLFSGTGGGKADTSTPAQTALPVGAAGLDQGRFGRIGAPVRDGAVAFTVTSVNCQPTQFDTPSGPRIAQGHFCLLALDLRNDGGGATTFPGAQQLILDSSNRRFSPDPGATAAHPANAGRDPLTLLLNPGSTAKVVLVFDLPIGVYPLTATLRASPEGLGLYISLS